MDNNHWITEEALTKLSTYKRRELYGEWLVESEEDKHLRELAETYHSRCEAYDRTICTGRSPMTGEAIPLTQFELGLVNKHARNVRESVIRAGEALGLSEEQVLQAIRHYCK